jgi:hypothetical protein
MSIAATAPGWESTIRAMRSMPTGIKREVSRHGRQLAEPVAREIRAVGTSQGSHAASVAANTKSSMRAGVPRVTAGGKPYTMGSEWGGQHRRTTYYSTSPLGRPYLITLRRSTMQFRVHKGQEGYWFTPTISDGGRGTEAVMQAWAELIDDVLSRF